MKGRTPADIARLNKASNTDLDRSLWRGGVQFLQEVGEKIARFNLLDENFNSLEEKYLLQKDELIASIVAKEKAEALVKEAENLWAVKLKASEEIVVDRQAQVANQEAALRTKKVKSAEASDKNALLSGDLEKLKGEKEQLASELAEEKENSSQEAIRAVEDFKASSEGEAWLMEVLRDNV